MNNFVSFLSISTLCLLLGGCAHEPVPIKEYFAVIEDIEDVSGQHYTVAKEREPLYVVDLRLMGSGENNRYLRLIILGFKNVEPIGKRGDRVSFRIKGSFPINGELSSEQLADYRILREQSSPALPP